MSAAAAGGGSKRVISVEKTSEGELKDYPDIDGNFVQPGSIMSDGALAEENFDRLPPKTATESALRILHDPERSARWKELFEAAIKDTDGKSLPDIDDNFLQPHNTGGKTPAMDDSPISVDYLKLIRAKG